VVTLAEAREKALANRREAYRDNDPRSATVPTFAAAAEAVIRLHAKSWKAGSRLPDQWRQSLRDHALPKIGRKSVAKVTTRDVLDVLTPIWTAKPATAKKVRQRIGKVMEWAVAKGYRSDNPAGRVITAALPKNGNGHRHHTAVPHAKVADVLATVRDHGAGVRELALEFLVLTACRTGEVAGAEWSEIDGDVWTVPPARVKTNRPHRVPLSAAALDVLAKAKTLAGEADPPASLRAGYEGGWRCRDATRLPVQLPRLVRGHGRGPRSGRTGFGSRRPQRHRSGLRTVGLAGPSPGRDGGMGRLHKGMTVP